jgi:hypothetical protein
VAARTETIAERVALNDATFREANEHIRQKTKDWDMQGPLPAICECADTSCTEILRLTPRQYEEVRANSRWFINAPDHHVTSHGWGRVVARHDGYEVVEKIGEAGNIVEQLDPREK